MRAPGNKKRSDIMPTHFQTPEEAGQFWDSHDSADYEKQMIVAECEINIQRKTYLVPLGFRPIPESSTHRLGKRNFSRNAS
jgi:hypothetical protein